jgi:hypothetical protein
MTSGRWEQSNRIYDAAVEVKEMERVLRARSIHAMNCECGPLCLSTIETLGCSVTRTDFLNIFNRTIFGLGTDWCV